MKILIRIVGKNERNIFVNKMKESFLKNFHWDSGQSLKSYNPFDKRESLTFNVNSQFETVRLIIDFKNHSLYYNFERQNFNSEKAITWKKLYNYNARFDVKHIIFYPFAFTQPEKIFNLIYNLSIIKNKKYMFLYKSKLSKVGLEKYRYYDKGINIIEYSFEKNYDLNFNYKFFKSIKELKSENKKTVKNKLKI